MYQSPNINSIISSPNRLDQKGFQNPAPFFYNPLAQKPSYPVKWSQISAHSPSFNPNTPNTLNPFAKNTVNLSGTESSEYLTPRIMNGKQDDYAQNSQGKANHNVKLTHLFGMNQRKTPQGPQSYSFLSTASSHDSEENLFRLNASVNYNSSNKAFSNTLCFPKTMLSANNKQNPYPLQDCRVKSLHISSNNNRKIEEQEEKDDEDLFLNISKFYINNVEEDSNEILNVLNRNNIEQEHKIEEKNNKKDMVFEITSSNKLEFNRKKKAFPEGNSTKYDIDLDYIENDGRTTLMIKNIPNKYDLDSLLANLRRNYANKYNFFYLPIDFNNKCNVGYAFINFVDTKFIRDFFSEFDGRKWEKFNSEKICVIKYARIQGLDALVSHFQFSSVMNKKDKNVRPVILQKNGLGNIEKLVQLQKNQNQQKNFSKE